jgi:hypothetical protein
MIPNSGQMTEHLRYSLVAVRELQNEINHPVQSMTDDTIASTLAFVCCAVGLYYAFSELSNPPHRTSCMTPSR